MAGGFIDTFTCTCILHFVLCLLDNLSFLTMSMSRIVYYMLYC